MREKGEGGCKGRCRCPIDDDGGRGARWRARGLMVQIRSMENKYAPGLGMPFGEWMISQSREMGPNGYMQAGGWMDAVGMGWMLGLLLLLLLFLVVVSSGRWVAGGRWLVEVGPISENPGGLNLFAAGTCTPFKDFDSHRAYPAACKNICIRQSAFSHNAEPCTARKGALSIFAFATLCAGPACTSAQVCRLAGDAYATSRPDTCTQRRADKHTKRLISAPPG